MAGGITRDGKITFYSRDQGRELQGERRGARASASRLWRWQLLDGHIKCTGRISLLLT